MTPQEAINTLNSIKQYYNDKNEDSYVGFDNEDNEALDMAIEALKYKEHDYYMRNKIHNIGVDGNTGYGGKSE